VVACHAHGDDAAHVECVQPLAEAQDLLTQVERLAHLGHGRVEEHDVASDGHNICLVQGLHGREVPVEVGQSSDLHG
jgi:hypothetical protein